MLSSAPRCSASRSRASAGLRMATAYRRSSPNVNLFLRHYTSFLFERVECSAAIAARDAISPREGAGHDADLIVTGAAAGPTLIAVVEQSKRGGVVES